MIGKQYSGEEGEGHCPALPPASRRAWRARTRRPEAAREHRGPEHPGPGSPGPGLRRGFCARPSSGGDRTGRRVARRLGCAALLVLAACSAPPGGAGEGGGGNGVRDPLQPLNRALYDFNEVLDRFLWKPLASTYRHVAPAPIRAGVRNFFTNLGTLQVAANQFLQGKFGRGARDLGRFALNTTVGLGGVFDPATDVGWPEHREDLGQTLARWGVGGGFYLVLPVLGPSTARDALSYPFASLLDPLTYWRNGDGQLATRLLNAADQRERHLRATDARDEAAIDPYVFTREAWLQKRRQAIDDRDAPATTAPDAAEPEASQQAGQELEDLLDAVGDF